MMLAAFEAKKEIWNEANRQRGATFPSSADEPQGSLLNLGWLVALAGPNAGYRL